jgi:hypothetical protein
MERPDGRDAGQGQYGTHAEAAADHAATSNQARSSNRAPQLPYRTRTEAQRVPLWSDTAALGATGSGNPEGNGGPPSKQPDPEPPPRPSGRPRESETTARRPPQRVVNIGRSRLKANQTASFGSE